MSIRLTFTLACAALAAACAPTTDGVDGADASGARPERQCFETSQVRNFRQGGTGTVYLRVAANEVYQADTAGGCFDLGTSNTIAVIPDIAGVAGGRVCVGDQARLAVAGAASRPDVCRARISKRLTSEEVAALPGAQRP